jgi:hypothetical protein
VLDAFAKRLRKFRDALSFARPLGLGRSEGGPDG